MDIVHAVTFRRAGNEPFVAAIIFIEDCKPLRRRARRRESRSEDGLRPGAQGWNIVACELGCVLVAFESYCIRTADNARLDVLEAKSSSMDRRCRIVKWRGEFSDRP